MIGPAYRFEAAVDENWWALEFVGAARRLYDNVASVWRTEVVAAWMRDRSDVPPQTGSIRTVRIAFSNDAGTTWAFRDFQSPNQAAHEFDPMACFDPISGSLFAGSMAGGRRDFIMRLDALDHELSAFGPLQQVFPSGENPSTQAHRPSAGAGPKPNELTESRVYVSAGFDLTWSDELGDEASWKGPITVGNGIQQWAVPRVGIDGQLYLAHRVNLGGGQGTQIRVERSIAIDTDADATPLFMPHSVAGTTTDALSPAWLPSNLRLTDVVGCAVAPHDGKRVYVVWMDRTSQSSNGCGTTNHNIDLYFSMTTDVTVTSPTWTTMMRSTSGSRASPRSRM